MNCRLSWIDSGSLAGSALCEPYCAVGEEQNYSTISRFVDSVHGGGEVVVILSSRSFASSTMLAAAATAPLKREATRMLMMMMTGWLLRTADLLGFNGNCISVDAVNSLQIEGEEAALMIL